jgi:hypothetical protein
MINDLAGDATIEVEGEYDPASDDKSTGEETATQGYHNFTGKASISGSRLTVVVHGSDIYLETEGSGSVMLSGEGSYKLDGYNGSSYTFNWAHVIDEDTDNENEEIE